MSQGQYSVIRCIPDAARGEIFNVGIAIWTKGDYRVRVDHAAARRAATQNANLSPHAFDNIQDVIDRQLQELDPINKTKFEKMRKDHRGNPYLFAESQFVNVPPIGISHLDVALEKLMDRLIRTRQVKQPQEESSDPCDILETKLLPLIANRQVLRKKVLQGYRTGRERRVDFFTGGQTKKIALDVLRMDVSNEESAMKSADAEAFKILDLKDYVEEYYVLPFVGKHVEQATLIETPVHKAIEYAKGQILKSVDDAVEILQREANVA